MRRGKGGETQVYLQMLPGESRILRTYTDATVRGAAWPYFAAAGAPKPIGGVWQVRFVDGGPVLPKSYETAKLDDPARSEAKRFAGTARYDVTFNRPAGAAADYLLDLGGVHESSFFLNISLG